METNPIGLNLASLASNLVPTAVPAVEEKPVETQLTETTPAEVVSTDDTNAETTPEEVDKPEEEKSVTALLKSEYLGEENATEFPETFEGISSLVKEVADSHLTKGRQAMMDELFTHMPELEDFLEYRLNGGKPEEYFKTLSEATTETLDLENVDNQKKAIRTGLAGKMELDEIETLIETLEETGKLKTSAERHYAKVTEANKTKASSLVAAQQAEAEKVAVANKAHWEGLKKIVDSGNLGTATIPTSERKAFYDWLAVPDKDGLVGQQKQWNAMTAEQKLQAQYFIFKKGDVAGLAVRAQNSAKVDETVKNLKPGTRLASSAPKSTATKIALDGIRGTTFQ